MDQITELIAEGKGKRLYAMENPDENHIYFACIKISGTFKSTAQ